MVVGGDLHAARGEVLHGVVGAAVAEGELVGPAPEGQGQELVAEADAEGGQALGEAAHGGQGGGGHLGVARPVAEEDALGLEGEDVLQGRVRGHHGDLAVSGREVLEDVLLEAEIQGHHAERRASGTLAGVTEATNPSGPSNPAVKGWGAPAVTRAVRSSPSMPGKAASRALSASRGVPSLVMMALGVPRLRQCRARARVSTPDSPTMPWRRR